MKWIFAAALALSLNVQAAPAAPDNAHLKAVQGLLEAMQAEKLVRMKAGMARYANDAQRQAVAAKVDKVAPQTIYSRLAVPVSQLVTVETATEMARFYKSDYGRKVVYAMYNSKAGPWGAKPQPSAAEKAEMKRPAFVKAEKALGEAEAAIGRQAFLLVQKIANEK
jgi:hypothetical protein